MTEHEQFAHSIAAPMLRPGERVLAIGVMYYDLPVAARVLLVFITLWIRVLMLKHYLAVATNQRLILIRTKQTWFTPKMMNRGVESIEYADITAIRPGFEPAAKKLILDTRTTGTRPLYMVGSCKVLPAQGQLHANFQGWVQAAIATGGALPDAGDSGGAAVPGYQAAGVARPAYQAAPPTPPLSKRLAPFNLLVIAIVMAVFSLFSGCTTAGCLRGASRQYDSVERSERRIEEYRRDVRSASGGTEVAAAKRALERQERWLDEYQTKAIKQLVSGAVFGLLSFVLLVGAAGVGFFWSKRHKVELAKQKEEAAAAPSTTGSAVADATATNQQPPPAGAPVSGTAFSAPASMPHPPAAQPSPPSNQGQAIAQPPSSASYEQPHPAAPQPFPPGSRVLVAWPNGQRYPATVVQSTPDKILCAFEGGQQQWIDAVNVSA